MEKNFKVRMLLNWEISKTKHFFIKPFKLDNLHHLIVCVQSEETITYQVNSWNTRPPVVYNKKDK